MLYGRLYRRMWHSAGSLLRLLLHEALGPVGGLSRCRLQLTLPYALWGVHPGALILLSLCCTPPGQPGALVHRTGMVASH